MNTSLHRIRKPVQRNNAERFLLYTLISFAASVSLTRLFLELTGYPQLGGGGLHIAHVLWGGLLLFIAALIPILFANRWAYTLDAIFAGAGVGLFIDEVGKFITQTNNYFYPPAAPIIYAFFLLIVLVYVRLRRPRHLDTRSELYAILEDMEEILDHDLTEDERESLLERMDRIEHDPSSPDLTRLVKELKDFVSSNAIELVPNRRGVIDRGIQKTRQFARRWVKQRDLRLALIIALIAMGIWVLQNPALIFLSIFYPSVLQQVVAEMVSDGIVFARSGLIWFEVELALQTSVGLTLLISAIFLAVGKDRRGIGLSYLGLLLSLTMADLLMFYINQFSTIVTAIVQFCVFMGVLYYRNHFLHHKVRFPEPEGEFVSKPE
ncbi:MAG: hypothetical protein M1281_11980 [Chloroflexi bacterium]|nr:hypothetical protein [Chloroflexota bacterium]